MRKEFNPKISDCFLVTGGQIRRLRDAATQEEAQEIVDSMRFQKYEGEFKKGGYHTSIVTAELVRTAQEQLK